MTQERKTFLAFDFGAESARAVVGQLQDKVLHLTEVHRFPTQMIEMNGHFYWNIFRFYEEMVKGVLMCVQKNLIPESIGIDTWGVDFGLLAEDDTFVRIPYAYRDPQVVEGMNDFHARVMPPEKIFGLTGISMQPFNSLYHMHAMNKNNDRALSDGRTVLFMPDMLNFLLCGKKKTEFTFATTSQLYNPHTSDWDEGLLASVGLNRSMLCDIIPPGVVIGELHDWICKQTGLEYASVVSVCSHDTGSAIVAVPVQNEQWAYISSGTWSLMGVEVKEPVVTEQSFKYNFSNEGGAEGTFRLLKNIMGLWLLQRCQSAWKREGTDYSYPELIELASGAQPFQILIDPDHPGFFNPEDMPGAIDEYCEEKGMPKPLSHGAYVRCILESLALKYRMVLEQIIEITGKDPDVIHIIGGGVRNKMLCQFTANATGKKVITGPAEGTAVGNLLMQAKAGGCLRSLKEIREVVVNTFDVAHYSPDGQRGWDKAYERFKMLFA